MGNGSTRQACIDNPPIAELQNVSRHFECGGVTALQEVSLRIDRGDAIAITGPSGSGKSTLLHILSGLDHPTGGRALFNGAAPRGRSAWACIRARHIGFVFQEFNLLPTLTAVENVQVPMFGVVPTARERARRAGELLGRVGLSGRATHRPAQLSGGERQRIAIARSLANAPDLILADEPTGNLDSGTSSDVMDLLCELHAEGVATLVIVTHDPDVAGRVGSAVRILDGRIVEEDK